MPLNKFLRLIEKPFLIAYALLWAAVYLLSRFNLELYTDHAPSVVWWLSFLAILPISLYTVVRTKSSKGENWYEKVGYFVMYTLLGLFTCNYIIVNGDLLISAAINKESSAQVEVTDVRKVFYRSGFDHTSVTLKTVSNTVVLQGRPYIYFYLNGKKNILVRWSKSFLGNEYVYTQDISLSEKFSARWLHFKDQLYRMWVFIGIMSVIILFGFFWPKSRDQTPRSNSPKLGFWKLLGIVMGIVFAVFLLFYVGLLIYMKFFTNNPL
ncbi:hypothetical protein [Pedobacter psychrodurus]|uniref:hypothetical protein n=1 Tax=Pedobacter psychrodurus TaxID=2530456 RepID=UPI00292EFEA5|nr:hypothetical protein [Pedobacter psychrodurus]